MIEKEPRNEVVDLTQWNIAPDQIASIEEFKLNVRFVTLTNGTVISLCNDVNVGNSTYVVTFTPAEPAERDGMIVFIDYVTLLRCKKA